MMSGVGRRGVGRRLASAADSDVGRRGVGRRRDFAVISDVEVSGDDLSLDVIECAA